MYNIGPVQVEPNKHVQATAYSLRSSIASASGSG